MRRSSAAGPIWGLVECIAYSGRRFRVDKLLIEAKPTGNARAQELRRLYKDENWTIKLPNPTKEKVAEHTRLSRRSLPV
ncbi:hypothetical protein [Bradyrhizobium sp. USDA 10063]